MVMLRHMQSIHPLATEVCRVLQNAGHQAYIVGGCVRDLHLGIGPKDWDITTSAIPEEVVQLFSRTIPTGLKHGTITVCMDEGVENHFEVTTFRIEGKYLDGRRPEEVKFVQNIEEDLARRDFTINAMAYDPIKLTLMDPFGGKTDLHDQIIQAVGDPNARFQEDGLRIMRAARFAARFGYAVKEATAKGMYDNLGTLQKVSKERINDELCKILMSQHPYRGLECLKETGALQIILPFLMSDPAWTTFLREQDKCQGNLATRVAFLYSNCTYIIMIAQELVNLKFSGKDIKRVVFLITLLDMLTNLQKQDTREAYIQFMATIKNHSPDNWEDTLEQFLKLTGPMGIGAQEILSKYREVTVWARKELVVNGDDLIAMGVKPGPEIKNILDGCYDEILEHPEHNNKECLMRLANTLLTLL